MAVAGREHEAKILDEFYASNQAEFMAIYGRRRVGKTYLIKNHFEQKKCHFMTVTGLRDGTFAEQREGFCQQISSLFYHGAPLATPSTWMNVFNLLHKAIESVAKKTKIVLFLDELPWLSTPRSRLLQALEYYWNQFWSNDKRIKLIVCGSVASWIMKNVINNTGGLYGRVTYRMKLLPFDLLQTKAFLQRKKVRLNNKQIALLYMVTGGIPLYLEKAKRGRTVSQIIDELCFSQNGLLVNEVSEMFKALFTESELYVDIVRVISKHRHGISKSEMAKTLKKAAGGRFNERINDLEEAGFIIGFLPYGHQEKGQYYRIIDEYTQFYFQWIEPNLSSIMNFKKASGYWVEHSQSSRYYAWRGYAFETLCFKHTLPILKKLELPSTALAYGWRHATRKGDEESGAQIDLLFDRTDDAITLCEIKFTDKPFVIDKEVAGKLKTKMKTFEVKTKTKKQLFMVLISATGIKPTVYSEDMVDALVTLDDLFD